MELRNGWAMTVNGPVAVGELGPTHVHEHLYVDCRPILTLHGYPVVSNEPLTLENAAEARWNPGGFPDNYHQTDVEQVIAELGPFVDAGGRTIVEVTPSHMSRSPEILKRISEASGVHVVMGGVTTWRRHTLRARPSGRWRTWPPRSSRSFATASVRPASGPASSERWAPATRSIRKRSGSCAPSPWRISKRICRSASTSIRGDSKARRCWMCSCPRASPRRGSTSAT
jgi:hypothetical protein